MSKFPLRIGDNMLRVIRLLGVIALGLVGLSSVMVLGRVSANMASQSLLVPALSLPGAPNDTETPTATITGTATLTATLTVTASPTSGTPAPSGTPDRVTICHRTGSQSNPYVMITVDRSALPAHARHGDIIPAPPGGCPAALTPLPTGTVTATPATTVTVTTTPAASPSVTGTAEAKVTICHRTGSAKNPYVLITVSTSALPAHAKHGDLIPAPLGGCPAVAPATSKKAAPGKSNGNGSTNGNGKGNGNGNSNSQPPGQQKDKGGGESKGHGPTK